MNSNLSALYPPEDLVIGEYSAVKNGVDCLVLSSPTKNTEDYGFIAIAPLTTTPEQIIWEAKTITTEAYVSGSGTLVIERAGGTVETYCFKGKDIPFLSIEVFVGDTMRWLNTSSTEFLFIFETCTPPHTDGRFLNLD